MYVHQFYSLFAVSNSDLSDVSGDSSEEEKQEDEKPVLGKRKKPMPSPDTCTTPTKKSRNGLEEKEGKFNK